MLVEFAVRLCGRKTKKRRLLNAERKREREWEMVYKCVWRKRERVRDGWRVREEKAVTISTEWAVKDSAENSLRVRGSLRTHGADSANRFLLCGRLEIWDCVSGSLISHSKNYRADFKRINNSAHPHTHTYIGLVEQGHVHRKYSCFSVPATVSCNQVCNLLVYCPPHTIVGSTRRFR